MSSLSTNNSVDQQPEKAATLIFIGSFLAGIGFLIASFLLPFLNSLFGLDFTIGFSAILLAFFSFVLINPRSRNKLITAWEGIKRAFRLQVLKQNPVKVLESYVKKLRKDIRKIAEQLGSLRGQMRRLTQQIEENKRILSKTLQEGSEAKSKAKKNKMIIKARKASRLQASNERLEALYQKVEILNKILSRIYTHSEILHEDIQDQVEIKKMEFKTMVASAKAMQSAKNVIGKNQKRRLFNQAVEVIADDIGNKVGEIERFMHRSSDFMNTVDFQSGYFEEEGLKMLEELEKESSSLLLNTPDEPSIDLKESNEDALDLNEKIKLKEKRNNPYDDLFE